MCAIFHTEKTVRQSNWHGNYTVLVRSRTTSLKSPYAFAWSREGKGNWHFVRIECHPHGTLTVTLRSTHTFHETKKAYAIPKKWNGAKNRTIKTTCVRLWLRLYGFLAPLLLDIVTHVFKAISQTGLNFLRFTYCNIQTLYSHLMSYVYWI